MASVPVDAAADELCALRLAPTARAPPEDYGRPKDHPYTAPENRVPSATQLRTVEGRAENSRGPAGPMGPLGTPSRSPGTLSRPSTTHWKPRLGPPLNVGPRDPLAERAPSPQVEEYVAMGGRPCAAGAACLRTHADDADPIVVTFEGFLSAAVSATTRTS